MTVSLENYYNRMDGRTDAHTNNYYNKQKFFRNLNGNQLYKIAAIHNICLTNVAK